MKKKVVLLMSGGLDSTVLFYQLLEEEMDVQPVFINYGQHGAEKEYQTILKILPDKSSCKVKIIDLSSIYSNSLSILIKEANLWVDKVTDDSLYIPYRNLVMFSAALAYAQAINVTEVYAAFINTYFAREIDASVEFLNSVKRLAVDVNNVQIILPFEKMSKLEVLELGIKLGAPVTITYSCQVNSITPCGACPNCVERLKAFEDYDKL